jgi:hypothetical protein
MIWLFSKFITGSIPASVSGSPEQRFFFWFVAGVIAEWLFVIGVWFLLKNRGVSFGDLGVWRVGTWSAWAFALALAVLSILSNLRLFPRIHPQNAIVLWCKVCRYERLARGDGLGIASTGDRVADLCCAGARMGGLARGVGVPPRCAAMSYLQEFLPVDRD